MNKWLQTYEKYIYVNCSRRNEYESDPSIYECYLTDSESMA